MNSQPWLTRVEVAEQLHYTPSVLWHLIKAGKFPVGTKIGDRYYHTQTEVDEYLAKQ
ncbi:MAG: helix-turn-helix domain-containing protein [Synergistaceae bacterium]|nr:helix-turn-helix domain-containing protein [Synergistaceae bacterium]